ncbi:MAG TPA: hypothetical protein VGI60_04770 [Chthoniobacterales bacterium]|jgi:autotransporter-associated beta strand protein
MKRAIPALTLASVLILTSQLALAGSATWNLNPATGDWNTATNWTPATVPNSPSNIATFDVSNITGVSLSAAVEVDGVTFNPGASAFTITAPPETSLTFSGTGIVNNSGVAQALVVDNTPSLFFTNASTAGELTSITVRPGSPMFDLYFSDDSDAGSAAITNKSTDVEFQFGSGTRFSDRSSAANATIINEAGAVYLGGGTTVFINVADAGNATIMSDGSSALGIGSTSFTNSSSAANATVIANGAPNSSGLGGGTTFSESSIADSATLIAYGDQLGRHSFGTTVFKDQSRGGRAHVEVYGHGTLDITQRDSPGITIGSLSGDGLVSLGTNNLTVGAGDFDSKFEGTISGDSSQNGESLTKIGAGTLVLTQPNSYFADTRIHGGNLLVRNRTGSATGTGLVIVQGGTFGGDGIVSGPVTVGFTTSGHKAALLAGTSLATPGVLTIQGLVTFNNSHAVCQYGFNSDSSIGAEFVAGGVTISAGSFYPFDSGTTTLTAGTVFTVISNTSASPISGTFSNLADGGTILIGSNTFQANYEGGDGNDLTLTVVP